MGSVVSVEPAAEVCRWLEWYGFDGLAARKGSAVLVVLVAEVCRWWEWYGFDSVAVRKGSAALVVLAAEEHRPAWKRCGSGWQAAAVFE